MFDTEYLVEVEGTSTLVSRRAVRGLKGTPSPEAEGEVQAYLVRESEGKALIELPGESVFGGNQTWVPASSFYAA